MLLQGILRQSIIEIDYGTTIEIIDQTFLPYQIRFCHLHTLEDCFHAIRDMKVRGAPLIGIVAAYGLSFFIKQNTDTDAIRQASAKLAEARPTAVNLKWALERMLMALLDDTHGSDMYACALAEARAIAQEDLAINQAIGEHGFSLIAKIAARKGSDPVQILTHCNAGWFATMDYGTATAPLYIAQERGVPVHVYVDETRPRNQGALTALEMREQGISHTVLADNAGGHLMQKGMIDMVIVGTDRVTRNGDVCNKIGTYLKALAAHDNNVPFYVAAPTPSIDFSLERGDYIPIEERSHQEVLQIQGLNKHGVLESLSLFHDQAKACNPGFDVTPSRLITGYITEKGIFDSMSGLQRALAA